MTTPNDSWKSPELRAAEAQVDARFKEAQDLANRLKDTPLPPVPPVDYKAIAQQVERAAQERDAPEQLKALKRKVDAGEFTWEDVVSGKAAQDPDVQAMQQENVRKMKQAFQMLQEGLTPEEIMNAQDPRRNRGGDDGDENAPDIFAEDKW
ncbi:hypothetical protein [Lentzea jiangxiensis]|uniref:Uncharacterized protein n=1 Tax=Lentzea jiangxiensis TaxID=641025 RepID=A0A1H0DVD2_9PSEU|nr:hypothetical protein [Lentzea jiangxiensis]SDN74038.1 hypothetical protein SAMN05421507_101129 [Lentzea jiangxiensis]